LFDSDVQVEEFEIKGNSYQCEQCWKWFHKSCVNHELKNSEDDFVCSECKKLNLVNKLSTKFGKGIDNNELQTIIDECVMSPTSRKRKRNKDVSKEERKKKRRKLEIAEDIEKIREKIHNKKSEYTKREEERKKDRKREKEKLALYKRKIERRLRRLEKIK
jgi:hypothetical protein